MDQQQHSASSEIAFFDVETTIPSRPGAGYSLLEFGAIVVCPRRLVELGSYSTLISPSDLSSISASSVRCDGITKDTVANAPSFRDVADQIFNVLHGRVWAGHNIVRFDCARIREAFAEIGRAAPEAKGMIDTLPLLTQRFGRRTGDMKMASLAKYFGLGQQKHRSLDDVRMNLEVLKYCATVLFLESSLPDVISATSLISENTVLTIQDNEIASPNNASPCLNSAIDLSSNQYVHRKAIEVVQAHAEPSSPLPDHGPSDLATHIEQMSIDPSRKNFTEEGSPSVQSPETCAPITASEGSSGCAGFLEPDEVSVNCICVSQVPFHYYGNRILLLHRDAPLQMCSLGIRVQFGISSKFFDNAGRPKLSIVVNVPANLCQVLDFCDRVAHKSSVDSGSSSEWRPVIRKNGYLNSSSIRLHIPTTGNGDAAIYSTEIYKKEPSRDNQKLVFSNLDAAVLERLFVPGTIIDAYFSLDIYDFQQNAGIRLVAKRLAIHHAMACNCLGVDAGWVGHESHSTAAWKWKKKKQIMRMKIASRSTMAVTHSSSNDGPDGDRKKCAADMVTFSSKISTEVPLYEPLGVSFSEYIRDRPRIFEAMFPDKSRSRRLNDEEWRIQMLPIRFLFASVNPVVDMRLRCKSHGKEYPPSVPLHVTRILEVQATRWELKGLEGISMPSHFDLNVQGVLYSVRRGSRSHLRGQLEISISLVLPPALGLVPMDVLKAVAESVLTRLAEKMKQEVDAGLLSDFSNFRREQLANTSQSTPLPAATTTISDGNPQIH